MALLCFLLADTQFVAPGFDDFDFLILADQSQGGRLLVAQVVKGACWLEDQNGGDLQEVYPLMPMPDPV